jgi:DNA repair exonuclease SbcCD ATPase subunit
MLMDDLRERVQKAERVAEEMRRHNEALQARLDDSNKEQVKQEDRIHEDDERIEELENEKRELVKKTRELESIFEAERAAVMKDREATMSREEELQSVIQRLKESLSQRDSKGGPEEGSLSRNGNCTAPLTLLWLTIDSQLHCIVIAHTRRQSLRSAVTYEEQLNAQ